MKKKILAFTLCMLLVANPCLAASTGVVTVSGGSIATGGLSGGYSEKTESAALTLTMAMLYGLGVSVKLSQDAINAGQSAYSFVKNKFYEWVGGTSAEQLDDSQYQDLKSRFEIINNGSNIDPDGNIYFNATAVDLIKRFLKWLDVSDYINNNSGGTTESVVNINGLDCPYRSSYTISGFATWESSESVALVWNYESSSHTRFNIFAVSNHSGVTGYRISNASTAEYSLTNSVNNYYYGSTGLSRPTSSYSIPSDLPMIPESYNYGIVGVNNWLRYASGDYETEESGGEVEGFNYEGDFDPDILNNPDDNNLVVQPDLVQGLQENNPNQQINIPVEQYLEALKQILNQATNPQAVPEPIPAQDLPTLSPVPVDVPVDLPLEWPVELPSSPDATPDLPTDNTPVTDPSTPVQPVDALPELTFNLDEYFPFCIPFDVYHLLSKFSADPVTPVFDIGFDEPFTNSNVNLHIDLSPWDSVASAIRTAELGAFIVGLAVASRSIFTRG